MIFYNPMGKGSLKSKQSRRDQLLGLLRSDHFWTTHKLATELSVSHRTLMRDLDELKEAGYPIESDRGRGGGISLKGRWGIDRLHLTPQEVISLLLSLSVTESLSSMGLVADSKSLKQKIANTFPDSQREIISSLRKRILIGDPASPNILSSYENLNKVHFEKIKVAFFDSQRLSIKYRDENKTLTHRQIDPHFFMLNWPVWYLLAWDYLRNDVRIFRIDRILGAKVLTEKIIVRSKALFTRAFEEYFSQI